MHCFWNLVAILTYRQQLCPQQHVYTVIVRLVLKASWMFVTYPVDAFENLRQKRYP
jgi:hypothetical protein